MQTLPLTTPARASLITGSVLWAAGTTVVCFRCLARSRRAGLGADDVFSIIATILTGSSIGMSAAVFTSGVGHDLDPKSDVYLILVGNLPRILELTFAYTLIYIWALAALKLSQLFLYLRTFRLELERWIFAGIALTVSWGVTFTFLFIFLCDPVSQQWTLARIGQCMDQITILKSLIITNVLTDLFIVALPVRTIWQLQMRRTEKIVVTLCFAMGLACCVIGIVRFMYLHEIDLLGNLTGTSQNTFILLTIELVLAVLCINIPTLRPYYVRLRAKYGSFWGSSRSGAYGAGGTAGTGTGRSHVPSSFGRQAGAGATGALFDGHNKQSGVSASALASTARAGRTIDVAKKGSSGDYAAWIELNDAESGAVSDDAGSERKLTRSEPPDNAVHISKKWTVTRE